jgi:hypothetical protein
MGAMWSGDGAVEFFLPLHDKVNAIHAHGVGVTTAGYEPSGFGQLRSRVRWLGPSLISVVRSSALVGEILVVSATPVGASLALRLASAAENMIFS